VNTLKLTTSEKIAYSTIRIECNDVKGNTITGTGFFYKFIENRQENTYLPVIITNKHVMKGAKTGKLVFTTGIDDDTPHDSTHFVYIVDDIEDKCIMHSDPDVDLCAFPYTEIIEAARAKNVKLFLTSLTRSIIPTVQQVDSLSPIEDILLIGYPSGLWDITNNKPIIRKGITATNPKLDYNGIKEFLIDASCFPGSSGSPVLIYNSGSYTDKSGSLVIGGRLFLIGILFANYNYTARGEFEVIDVPTLQKPVPTISIHNNLGLVIKSERILELEEPFLRALNILETSRE
jgi:hypothetical protein